MMTPGRQSNVSRTAREIFSSETVPVPKVFTSSETGSATPIA